jgi:hypothetical protein
LGDVGWYGGAYLLTSCSFQLPFGRIYTYYSPKIVFLLAILIFEVGSAICGAAPNSTALIIGRAIAGLGSSGIFSGSIIIIVHTVPLAKRPIYQSIIGSIFGLASVVGPLLGGAFTQNVTWRWCFYINLPVGALAFAIIAFILKLPKMQYAENLTAGQRFAKLDPLGTVCLLPALISLLLALQWGGSIYPWNNGRIIGLFVVFGVLTLTFTAIQIWRPDTATVPSRIIKNQSIWAGVCFSVAVGSVLVVEVYYLPIWFQAILGVDAVQSGIRLLPVVLALVFGSFIAGWTMGDFGYYTPFMYGCAVFMAIGTGLITTFTTTTSEGKWIGYQIILGVGLGFGMQPASLAAQTVLPTHDVSTGVSLMLFAQSLGGAVCIAIAQSVFTTTLVNGLSGVPKLDPNSIVHTGATEIRNIVDPAYLPTVLNAYNYALTKAFIVGTALACFTIVGAVFMEWRSTRQEEIAKAKRNESVELAEPDRSGAAAVHA